MSRGHKERTPAQLAVLAQAREKATIVIAERAKLWRRKTNLNLCWKTLPNLNLKLNLKRPLLLLLNLCL